MFFEFLFENMFLAVSCGLLGGATLYMWSQAGSSFALDVSAAVMHINEDNAQPVDLRAQGDFDSGHVPGARHLPAADLDEAAARKLAAKRPLLLVCANGMASAAQAKKLHAAGITNVATLKGGQRAWLEAGQPTHRRKKK